jgi:ubiquinone/menaquinone biosynthesis C-methylase UbiE
MAYPKGYVYSQNLQIWAERLKADKLRTYELMHIQPGDHVLDVGCGPGVDTISLAQVVGPTGQVVGVDHDAAMLAEASQRAVQAGVAGWVHYFQGEAFSLPFATGIFDACRSERLFQHLVNPALALAEMVRVTRPSGWVVVLDTDWGTRSIDTDEVEIERRLARFETEHMNHNGYAGRQLYRLFKQQPLADIVLEMRPFSSTSYALIRQGMQLEDCEAKALAAGVVTEEELRRWRRSLEQAEGEGVFFCSLMMTLAAGRRPGLSWR